MVALGSGNNTPKRIQMSRQRPWRAENPDAVIVARPSRWGNPFSVSPCIDASLGFRVVSRFYGDAVGPVFGTRSAAINDAIKRFRRWALANPKLSVESLRARDLACWCPLDQPCHADVLLELANGTRS